MRVHFWGTRGSLPTPGPTTLRFGGNTSCVDVRAADGTYVILDCGTGARQLGTTLPAVNSSPINLFLTHTHWDHIQGFPFFAPAYLPSTSLDIYAGTNFEHSLEEALSGQMQHTYFPVRLSDLQAQIAIHEIGEGAYTIGGLTLLAQHLNHTAPCLGYRLEAGGVSVAYVTDHEPFLWTGADAGPAKRLLHPGDHRHAEWLAGVDLLIHDAQYTDAEYPDKRHWGHSPAEYVVDLAIIAGVKRLALFHHDPDRADLALADLARRMQQRVRDNRSDLEVIAAAEGLDLDFPESAATGQVAETRTQAVDTRGRRILLVGGNETELAAVQRALEPDGYRFAICSSVEHLDSELTRQRWDLIISLARAPSEGASGRLIERLRAATRVGDHPLIAMASEAESDAAEALSFNTDFVPYPMNVPMLRVRVRAWLLRSMSNRPVRR